MRPIQLLMLLALVLSTSPAAAAKIVFLIGEYEYGTKDTLPAFAKSHLQEHECVFLHATSDDRKSDDRHDAPGMETIENADLLVISLRRRALPEADLNRVRGHIAAGKSVIALRTGTHAFSLRNEEPPAGHAVWDDFDVAVLGAKYEGHLDNDVTDIFPHPVSGIRPFKAFGKLYRIEDLTADTTIWATGEAEKTAYPVIWSRRTSAGTRIFSTTMGAADDFQIEAFTTLLDRGFDWTLQDSEDR